jgi:hypothetical protein
MQLRWVLVAHPITLAVDPVLTQSWETLSPLVEVEVVLSPAVQQLGWPEDQVVARLQQPPLGLAQQTKVSREEALGAPTRQEPAVGEPVRLVETGHQTQVETVAQEFHPPSQVLLWGVPEEAVEGVIFPAQEEQHLTAVGQELHPVLMGHLEQSIKVVAVEEPEVTTALHHGLVVQVVQGWLFWACQADTAPHSPVVFHKLVPQ